MKPGTSARALLRVASVAAIVGCSWPATLHGQGPPGWRGDVRLGFVTTDGNSETETLSLRTKLNYDTPYTKFDLRAGGLQTRTTSFLRFAELDNAGMPVLVEEPSTSLSAERYWTKLHVRQVFGPAGLFWFSRLEWDRNVPAGIKNRYSGIGGLGNDWVDNAKRRFWTEYGWTFNRERRRIEGLERATNFPGLRLEWEFWWKLSESSQYRNELVVNQNLDDTADLRAEMSQELQVGLSERFSLIVALEQYYDDDPPLNSLPIVVGGVRTGENVLVAFDKLDTYLSTSLVFHF